MHMSECMCVFWYVCVCVCVRACVRACVRVCALHAHVWLLNFTLIDSISAKLSSVIGSGIPFLVHL